ncbi:hypothetical protein C922_02310 [Plasmodium inui San Antonio 1]|uniref:Uncharacterized protein n=1 Tax=Plasmodium inui San Antonio 1 TaxID=1237626 RepID=W7A5V4_9APIC|nr:hypothetical protein C922_02310 [Plasmodium inui San Antonio 1]EUD67160.1 hypothetical protein C922_02310 [Plasmodium inui San Antonio 1]
MKCFLCDSEVLPTLNTFIVLDIVLEMLKGSGRGGIKSKGGKKKKKKALYLTNRIMMEKFPPNFDFILGFINGTLRQQGGKLHQEAENLPHGAELCDVGEEAEQHEPDEGRNSFRHPTQWSIHTVKDIKKGTVDRGTHFELPPMKEPLSLDKFKRLLKGIHIKYIEKEEHQGEEEKQNGQQKEKSLTEALYNLNEQKEYNLVIVNLAFLFVKDKKRINIYAENVSMHYMDGKTKHSCADSLNNTNEILFSPPNRNHFPSMLMEKEIYDVPFFKNILSFHFCYSFLVNFDEHLNHDRVAIPIGNSIDSKVTGPYKDAQRSPNRDCSYATGRGELSRGRRNTYRARGRAHHRDAERTDRFPKNDQRTIATRLNHNFFERHSVRRKRKLGEIERGDLISGGYSGASPRDRERGTPEEGSRADVAAPRDDSDGERHTGGEHRDPHHLRNLSDLSGLSNDDPRRENITMSGSAYGEDFLTPRKRKKKKGNKKHLYTFDVLPKSDQYKRMYLNMLSLYCDCVCLIS